MKIFGIGLNKTGTTTLRDCLQTLGYRVKGFDRKLTHRAAHGELEPVFDVCEHYDAFQDLPWPLLFRELDARYPGSKFLLTIRSSSDIWFQSLKKHAYRFGPNRHRALVYGKQLPHGHRRRYIARYEQHNADVRHYFADRPNDLLEICWETGSGWPELCKFLGHPVPDASLPHANRSSAEKSRFLSQLRTNSKTFVSLLLDR